MNMRLNYTAMCARAAFSVGCCQSNKHYLAVDLTTVTVHSASATTCDETLPK